MFHAINAWLGRHARQIRDLGLARDHQTAAGHRWQARQITPGTWQYRDPRFDRFAHCSRTTAIRISPAASRVSSHHGGS
jgi:hypothetical protein